MSAEKTVTFDWEFEGSAQALRDAEAVAAEVRSTGGQAKVVEHTDSEILPALGVAVAVWGVIALGRFAVYVAEKIRDWNKTGIQITNNGTRVSIRHIDIPPGWILYIDPKGATYLYDTKKDAEITKEILDAAGQGLVPAVPSATSGERSAQARSTAG